MDEIDLLLRKLRAARNPESLAKAVDDLRHSEDPRVRLALRHKLDELERPAVRYVSAAMKETLLLSLMRFRDPDDWAIAAKAMQTYVFLPPNHTEVASGYRAAGLRLAAAVEQDGARFYAAQLLVDPHTSELTGQPAVTASQILGQSGDDLALYMRLGGISALTAEVVASCLSELSRIPVKAIPYLVNKWKLNPDPVVQLALVDLLIDHEQHEQLASELESLVRSTDSVELVEYIGAKLVATRRIVLIETLAAVTDFGSNGHDKHQALRRIWMDLEATRSSPAAQREERKKLPTP